MRLKFSIIILTASLLTGCFPSNPKSEAEIAIDKEQKGKLVGTWVLKELNGDPIEPKYQTRISFSDNGIAKTWLGKQENTGKWVFTDSAKVVAIQQGNTGERFSIISLTETKLKYAKTNGDVKNILTFQREK